MSVAINVEHLSKSYILKHQKQGSYVALRDIIADKVKSVFTRDRNFTDKEEFLALDDVSFSINSGDTLGIIGRNGAGKSTLLKVLSRIVTPTKGNITIDGRVASLLEVGTGFHPELSGRENIFLNGSILGMSRTEIKRKFDEIVDFAEVEKFLDTPVKRYSSGMYVRLAFAVAAHLEPEILIVDEVLAVGDAQFQKKCLGKMADVSSKEDRTILFVSHNIAAIRTLCKKGLLLVNGRVEKYDAVDAVLPHYLGILKDNTYKGIQVKATPLTPTGEWALNTDISIEISWETGRFAPGWQCDVASYTLDGLKIFALQSEKFSDFNSDDPKYNSVNFIVRNPGFSATDMRLDVGIKPDINSPYSVLIENCMVIHPSDKGLPAYNRIDVIVVPTAKCIACRI